jgi:hypothetical protein
MDRSERDWSRPILDHVHRRVRDPQAAIALIGAGREQVDAFHAAGCRDDGAPGLRDHMPGSCAASLLGRDGANVEAVHRNLTATA